MHPDGPATKLVHSTTRRSASGWATICAGDGSGMLTPIMWNTGYVRSGQPIPTGKATTPAPDRSVGGSQWAGCPLLTHVAVGARGCWEPVAREALRIRRPHI